MLSDYTTSLFCNTLHLICGACCQVKAADGWWTDTIKWFGRLARLVLMWYRCWWWVEGDKLLHLFYLRCRITVVYQGLLLAICHMRSVSAANILGGLFTAPRVAERRLHELHDWVWQATSITISVSGPIRESGDRPYRILTNVYSTSLLANLFIGL